jgi:hypothetical protein
MPILVIRFLNIVMAALVAGTMFGIWTGYNPQHLSAQAYVEQQQSLIKALNTLMPLLGWLTLALTLAAAFLQRANRGVLVTLLIAAVFLTVSGLVTRFGNQPINGVVMSWNIADIPSNWTELRDKWWSLHRVRATTALVALCLIVWSGMRRD